MSYGNQSYLRFSLEESIWFQKGQEVAELVSISLDPNITIQESDQYVTIKGSLELSGEYIGDDREEEELDYFSNPKFVQSVETREEGVHLFSHHFPVEITIPKNRIQNAFDIDVGVETFDYAFPERSCLKLSADLMITGLYGELQHERLHEQDEIEDFEAIEEINEINEIDEVENDPPVFYTPFEVEARKEPEVESTLNKTESKIDDQLAAPFRDEEGNAIEDVYEYENEILNREGFLSKSESKIDDQLVAPLRSEEENAQEIVCEYENENEILNREEFETKNPDENPNHFEIEVEVEPEKEIIPEIIFSAQRKEEQQPSTPEAAVSDELEEEIEDETNVNMIFEEEEPNETENETKTETESSKPKDKKDKGKGDKWKNKKSLTLSEFFARKEEETHTKLTVCIVQHGDSLNSLSERYEVPVSQLQKVNQLELNQDISEGQVLYIPLTQPQR